MNHLVDSFGKVGFDSTNFKQLRCGLYINEYGTLGYKAKDNSLKFDTLKSIDIFLTTVYNANPMDSINGGMKEMKLVVDTASLIFLQKGNFQDKNHFYFFNQMSDGGTIAIRER